MGLNMEERLQALKTRIEREHFPTEGLLWAQGEKILWEHRFTKDLPRNIYSHTKSFTATMVGLALDAGKISLSDKPVDYFPEDVPENADPKWNRVTLEHLLTMSSGADGALLMMPHRGEGEGGGNYNRYIFSKPVKDEPGTVFLYSNGDTYLAGRMAEKALGRPMEEVLREKVFVPMGIEENPVWERDKQGHVFGASGLHLTLRDMNKLGILYLCEGTYQGKQILSREFVKEASRVHIPTGGNPGPKDWHNGYGYQCWKLPYGSAYRFDGAYGQFTCVLPEQNMVIGVQSDETTNMAELSKMMHEELFFDL